MLSLSSKSLYGIFDPWQGTNDILSQSYRFIRNGFYWDSPLVKSHRDLELFSALHYLRIVLQSGVQNVYKQPGFRYARSIVKEATNPNTFRSLQSSDYLRSRLRYLCYNTCIAPQPLMLS